MNMHNYTAIANEHLHSSKSVIGKRFDFCELFGGILFKFPNLK